MKRICVFCGSNPGTSPEFVKAATELGRLMAAKGIGLVYGGAGIGLMGAVADAVMKAGGEAIGILPEHLMSREIAHPKLTELIVVKSMHERKALMEKRSDAFIALPGGFGTFEEFFEIVTWAQLGLHHKPSGLLNVNGFYTPLLDFIDRAGATGFIKPEHRKFVLSDSSAEVLLEKIISTKLPTGEKWITDSSQT